jgi:hypothetical protein
MPIWIAWYNEEKTILLETFDGEWTIEDYHHLIDDVVQILGEVDHTVHIIVDGRKNASGLPANMLGGGMLYAVRNTPPNQGTVVFVGVDTISKMLLDIARSLDFKLHRTLFSADSMDEALQIIAQTPSPSD